MVLRVGKLAALPQRHIALVRDSICWAHIYLRVSALMPFMTCLLEDVSRFDLTTGVMHR